MPTTYRTITPRTYIIRDLPAENSPVGRLQADGGETVPLNELLEVALGARIGTGQSGEYGTRFLAGLRTVPQIIEALGLDPLQAARLLAVLSIGRRLYAPEAGALIQIRGIEDVYRHCQAMSQLAKEQLRVLLINGRYQLVYEETLSIGGVDSVNIQARDVFQPAVERRVTAIILVHNHPSGDPTPGESDFGFTQDMRQAGEILGIELLDHVIIGRDSYRSCLVNSTTGTAPDGIS